jgi:hypothetical protein
VVDEGGEDRRRAPEKSVLHEAFRRGWPEVSSSMPTRVKREGERFLTCGDVRAGFVEVACESCSESRLVAFSCKGRGWCPSCTTRRALDTGVRLESLLPRVAHRQWTLSLPFSVRFQVVKKPTLLKRLEVRLVKAVWRWQRREARRHGATGALTGGAICFWQWFGSSLQLTPHRHLVAGLQREQAPRPRGVGVSGSPRFLLHPLALGLALGLRARALSRADSSVRAKPLSAEATRARPAMHSAAVARSAPTTTPPLRSLARPSRPRRFAPRWTGHFWRADPVHFSRAPKDVLRVLPHWPKDRYLELAPLNFAATRARLDATQLEAELGPLTVPAAT